MFLETIWKHPSSECFFTSMPVMAGILYPMKIPWIIWIESWKIWPLHSMMTCIYAPWYAYHDAEVHTSMEVNSVDSTLLRTLRSYITGGEVNGQGLKWFRLYGKYGNRSIILTRTHTHIHLNIHIQGFHQTMTWRHYLGGCFNFQPSLCRPVPTTAKRAKLRQQMYCKWSNCGWIKIWLLNQWLRSEAYQRITVWPLDKMHACCIRIPIYVFHHGVESNLKIGAPDA